MPEEKSSVIVAVFDNMAQAEEAYNMLRSSGFGDDYLGLANPRFENKNLGKELAHAGVPDSDSRFYQNQFDIGRPLVTVRVGGLQPESIKKARTILMQKGAFDANSADRAGGDFAANVKQNAKTPFFDLKTGMKESEDTK